MPAWRSRPSYVEHELFTHYQHLRAGSVVVANGDAVSAGDRLACIGNSGNNPGTTNHVHIEARVVPLGEIDEEDVAAGRDFIPSANFIVPALAVFDYPDTGDHEIRGEVIDVRASEVAFTLVHPGDEADPYSGVVRVLDEAGSAICERGFTLYDVLLDDEGEDRCRSAAQGRTTDGWVYIEGAPHAFGDPEFEWTYRFRGLTCLGDSSAREVDIGVEDLRGNRVNARLALER